jgi:bis(5'-nucleosyl)-tetraphosphatase (symmetrical)
MALYAIGDIQGCHSEFRDLLDLIGFDASRDRLWLVGDLVNRGPGSLAVLRDVMAMGDAATAVTRQSTTSTCLTIAAGHRKPHRGDTLDDISRRRIATRSSCGSCDGRSWRSTRNYVLVHAGLLPSWTPAKALALSREVEAMLASDRAREFLGVLYGDEPRQWRATTLRASTGCA